MRGANLISALSLVILIGYIIFNETRTVGRTSGSVDFEAYSDNPDMIPGFFAFSVPVPENMTFAGERVPLEVTDVRERLDRELHINTYWHNNTIFLMKRANRWLPIIEEILKQEGIPEDFKYLPAIEGSFRNDISPKQAVGFWQIRKATGRELGLEINREVDERYSPVKATYAACKYLRKSYEKLGNWTLVAAAYNRGNRGIERALENQKVSSYYDLRLNDETSRYVFRILAAKEILENPEKYNFNIEEKHLYQPYEVKSITIEESINDIPEFAIEQGITYKELVILNPWLRTSKLTVSKGESYTLYLPAD